MGSATDEINRRQADAVGALISSAYRAAKAAIFESHKHPDGQHTRVLLQLAVQTLEAAGDTCTEEMMRG